MPTNTEMDACKLQISKLTFHFRMRSHLLIMMHCILGIIALLLAENVAAAMNSYLGLLQGNLASDYLSYPPPHNFLNLPTSFHRRGFSSWPLTKSRHTHLSGSCLYCSHFFIWHAGFCTSTIREPRKKRGEAQHI